ncbi:MAG: glycosyltransferase family 4 protein, partial [Candidatus Omnitrophica bacterium]|nr:glycosyltransferase family 4 protein [Candidatus Omnitrophota bacterium]
AMPLVLLEAMASGVPVAATRVGAIPEVISHRQDGFIFDVDDHLGLIKMMHDLLDRSVDVSGMIGQARKKIETRYSLEQMADQYFALYKHILEDVDGDL